MKIPTRSEQPAATVRCVQGFVSGTPRGTSVRAGTLVPADSEVARLHPTMFEPLQEEGGEPLVVVQSFATKVGGSSAPRFFHRGQVVGSANPVTQRLGEFFVPLAQWAARKQAGNPRRSQAPADAHE